MGFLTAKQFIAGTKTAAVKQPRRSQDTEKWLRADLLRAKVLLFITEYRQEREREGGEREELK